MTRFFPVFVRLAALVAIVPAFAAPERKPNIVVILADDLGYGDIRALNPARGRIPTPRLDALAAQGMAFGDAHGSSSLCTPTRYGILTGRYDWRSRLPFGVLVPYDAPLIDKNRLTMPGMLRSRGYDTACFGKWHLGWDWPKDAEGRIDFSKRIGGGPTDRGFDHAFGVDVPNYPPYCFIEDGRTVGIPSAPLPASDFKNNRASNRGLAVPGWSLEAVLPGITDKVCAHIRKKAAAGKPFFIYYALTSPHTPIAPTREWRGKSGLGAYGDFVMETDAMIGRVLDTLKETGAADDTVVVFASDNGFASYVGAGGLEKQGHFPSADRRGYKADAWDGGHHIPLIVRWPALTKPGAVCNELVCLNDLMATFAEATGAVIPANAAEDSVSLIPLLAGGDKPVRETLVHHSGLGYFAIREGRWKLILCGGGGGQWSRVKAVEGGVQLYDMTQDVSERRDLAARHPEIVARLRALLQAQADAGRSTPGPAQKNDTVVNILGTKPASKRAH